MSGKKDYIDKLIREALKDAYNAFAQSRHDTSPATLKEYIYGKSKERRFEHESTKI